LAVSPTAIEGDGRVEGQVRASVTRTFASVTLPVLVTAMLKFAVSPTAKVPSAGRFVMVLAVV
jgi:hypothetical protein